MSVIKKGINIQVKNVDKKNRTFTMIGTDETIDRDRERILVEGWEFDDYKKNPVVLFGHDAGQPPVAKTTEIKIEKKQVLFDLKFPDEGDYPFADIVFKLYAGGFMRASSVRFFPKEWVDSDGQPDEDGNATPIRTYTRQSLVELSLIPIPANPSAVITSRSLMKAWQDNAITQKEWDEFCEVIKKFGKNDEPAKVKCSNCEEEFVWEELPEEKQGVVKCPKCGFLVDQEGKATKSDDTEPAGNEEMKEIKKALGEVEKRIDAFEMAFNERLDSIETVLLKLSEGDGKAENYVETLIRAYREEANESKSNFVQALKQIKDESKK